MEKKQNQPPRYKRPNWKKYRYKIFRNGKRFVSGDKCPACSVERDTGGRLQIMTRRPVFALKCNKCFYIMRSETEFIKRSRPTGGVSKVFH